MEIINRILSQWLVKPDLRVNLTYYGTEYGGFYVKSIPPNKDKIIVYSFGIGEDLSFSEELLNVSKSYKIFAFDPTPKSQKYVQNHFLSCDENFKFYKIGLSSKNENKEFFLPVNTEYVSGSVFIHKGLRKRGLYVKMRNLRMISHKLGHKHIDLVKMDIEGCEFDVVDSLDKMNVTIDQICMETHERFFKFGFLKLIKLHLKLHSMGYVLVGKNNNDLTYILKSIVDE